MAAIDVAIKAIGVKIQHLEEFNRLIRLHDCETAFSESKSEIERYSRRVMESFLAGVGSFQNLDVMNTSLIAQQLFVILRLDYSIEFIHVRSNCLTALCNSVHSIRMAVIDSSAMKVGPTTMRWLTNQSTFLLSL